MNANTGASAEDIQYHYDISDSFFELFLDDTKSYSCALWHNSEESLETAQINKVEYHLQNLKLRQNARILDIGCGWGYLLQHAIKKYKVESATGLTLSKNQKVYIDSQAPLINVALEDWRHHKPRYLYDGIVSVGAFEHFAKPHLSKDEKQKAYKDFFDTCENWLQPGARLSLQTIAYEQMEPSNASSFIQNSIFPGSELPLKEEILHAADNFSLLKIVDHGDHYARTCERWLRNLVRQRSVAFSLVGEERCRQFEAYLRMSSMGFSNRQITLNRYLFEKR